MSKRINLPIPNTSSQQEKVVLPFCGNLVHPHGFSFSFSCFDRTHDLFNLGDNSADGVVSGKWFLDLLDCLKNVSIETIANLKNSHYQLHPVDWDNANARIPDGDPQREYWQFRISKSKGRIIGILIDHVFYVVWLDPHHNLCDSEGYGGVNKYAKPMSQYETQKLEIEALECENSRLKYELRDAEELMR